MSTDMTDEERWANWPEETRPDYCITISFKPGIENPQRIFQAAADFIRALQEMDTILLSAIDSKIQPVFLLEKIEEGSLKVWVKQILEAIPDDSIRSLDWKKAVGTYLVKVKHFVLRYLDDNKSLGAHDEFRNLTSKIFDAASSSGALKFPAYKQIPASDVAKGMAKICEAVTPLHEGERITISNDDGDSSVDASAQITQEQIEDLLACNTIRNSTDMILMVRKPDFLGTSMWEFRHEKKNFCAKMADEGWLKQFQHGELDIRPGHALRALVDEDIVYGEDGEVIRADRTITKVNGVIRTNQSRLNM